MANVNNKFILSQICKCGKIHFVEEGKYENYAFVCKNCGMVFTVEWSRKRKMTIPHNEKGNVNISRFDRLVISEGDDIFMMTGNPATYYADGRLVDFGTKPNPTLPLNRLINTRNKVDMRKTLRYIYSDNIRSMYNHYKDSPLFDWSWYDPEDNSTDIEKEK